MTQISERLHLGSCGASSLPKQAGYSLVFACHYPCSRMLKNLPGLASCAEHNCPPGQCRAGKIFFWDVPERNLRDERPGELLDLLDQLQQELQSREVVIISEDRESRAATLALLWLALRGKQLPKDSFAAARSGFSQLYPPYRPDPNWSMYLEREWEKLRTASDLP